jgi:hypothetical protein
MAKLGDACGTNLVMKGIKADGTYECVTAGIAPDMINEISNDLIWNQFVDSANGTKDVQIKDGFAAGVTDTLAFPDVGVTQKLWVDLNVSNSDVSKVVVELYGPGMSTPYLLYNGGKTGSAVVAKYNDGDALVSGDINKDWLGKNIKGNWSITVKDTAAITVPPGTPAFVYDGKFNWSISIQTLSSKKVQIKGNLIVDGTLTISGAQAGLNAGTIYNRACPWTWQSNSTWQISASSCTPPACASGHTDLGVQQKTRSTTSDYDPWCCWHSTTVGTSERLCLIPPATPSTVYYPSCQWMNSSYNSDNASVLITSCTPPACASGHTDLGTQNIPNAVHTETDYPNAHDANTMGGWTERVCAIMPK